MSQGADTAAGHMYRREGRCIHTAKRVCCLYTAALYAEARRAAGDGDGVSSERYDSLATGMGRCDSLWTGGRCLQGFTACLTALPLSMA